METDFAETAEVTIENNWDYSKQTIKVKRPPITPGDLVTWYRNADRNSAHPAIVQKVGDLAVTVMLLASNELGREVTSVYHIDDERLKDNQGLKNSSGAWDYTAQTKATKTHSRINDEVIKMLAKRIDSLEALLTEPKPRDKGSK